MAPLAGDGLTFSVATWNLRGVSDRWAERRPLLAQALREMDADVVCFQEVLTGALVPGTCLLPLPLLCR